MGEASHPGPVAARKSAQKRAEASEGSASDQLGHILKPILQRLVQKSVTEDHTRSLQEAAGGRCHFSSCQIFSGGKSVSADGGSLSPGKGKGASPLIQLVIGSLVNQGPSPTVARDTACQGLGCFSYVLWPPGHIVNGGRWSHGWSSRTILLPRSHAANSAMPYGSPAGLRYQQEELK